MIDAPLKRLLRAGLLTALSDGLFASVQTLFTGSTVTRVWQGVASTLLGPSALTGGTRTALIGILMHVGVAFAWSTVFLVAALGSSTLRRNISTRSGILITAAAYGPVIWIVMSVLVIPALLHRPPAITPRWWVQFFGHMVFVGLPIVSQIAAGVERTRGGDAERVAAPAVV